MTRTPEQVSQDIRDRLELIDSSFTAALGTPERKIIDAVSEVISSSTIDSDLSETMWDIDTKTDIELEQFVGLFGFGRYEGKRATGELTITIPEPAAQPVYIVQTMQATTEETDVQAPVPYNFTVPGVINEGESSITLPAECAIIGSIGNTVSNTIVQLPAAIGQAFITNKKAFAGGIDAESDEDLRQRFKDTFMRNLAGTEDFYEALCLMYQYCSKVNVIGPVTRYKEQLEFTTSGSNVVATSQIKNSKYTWPKGEFLTVEKGQEDEFFYTRGVHYNVEYVIPPKFTSLNSDPDDINSIKSGTIVDVEHEYTSVSSRNDPAKLITNKVDIFVNARETIDVYESGVVSARTFSSTTTSPDYNKNFVRLDDTNPTVGKVFTPLGSTPIVNLPETITVNGAVKKINTDYRLVVDNTLNRGSSREVSGIEWINDPRGGNSKVTFTLNYTYNQGPQILQAMMEMNRQITTDVMVHEATVVPLKVNAFLILEPGYSLQAVQTNVETALTAWANALTFGDWIQLSDIEAVVHGCRGVDAVRIIRQAEAVNGKYGLELMKPNGTIRSNAVQDFRLLDNQVLRFDAINIVRRSTNTFGAQ